MYDTWHNTCSNVGLLELCLFRAFATRYFNKSVQEKQADANNGDDGTKDGTPSDFLVEEPIRRQDDDDRRHSRHQLQLTATSNTGLPDISSLRIFPLDGLMLPTEEELTGIKFSKDVSDYTLYYNLNGVPSSMPHRGINIVREIINGKFRSYKIVKT